MTLSENFDENVFLLVILVHNKFKSLEVSKIDVQRDVGAYGVKCQDMRRRFLRA
jgi:hypothetical protein